MTNDRLIKIMIGPLLLIIALMLPFLGPIKARIGFGILFWMVYWWVTVAVDIKITCLVPIIVVAFYPFVSREEIFRMYMHEEFFLILGATMIAAGWIKWGFARRVALKFLSMFSNNVRTQTVAWFLLCGTVSFIMGNTTVGAIFAPIAVAALLFAGYKTFEQRYNSKGASNILIAVAWGASIGGMTTPLGGGQALVTWGFFQKYLKSEIFFLDWTLRMLPVSLLVMAAVALFMYYFMKPDPGEENFQGTKDFYKKELQAMGPMGFEEKICFYGFALVIALAIARPLYADLLKGPAFEWLHPSAMFFIFASLLFFTPSVKEKGESVLSLETLKAHFPVAILFIWPGAIALGRVLQQTGASKVFASWMQPMLDAGTIPAIFAISLGSTMLSQFVSDTAAAGILVPLMIDAFKNWGGLQYGAVAFIWISSAALSWSFAVVSATGAQAISAGYGANIKRMFVYGIYVAIICALVTTLYFVVTVGIMNWSFYTMPPVR
ncbi:MAG: SLC13 family permease [Bacillota bacterium]